MVGGTAGAPYDARYTISDIRTPLDWMPMPPPQVAVHRIDYPYPLSAIPSLLYNSLFQANPSRPIRELAAAGPQLPAV